MYKVFIIKRIFKKLLFIFLYSLIFVLIAFSIYSTSTPKNNIINFYFVEVDSLTNYSQAEIFANEIKNKNGAGFIYSDLTHVIIWGCCLNKKDAVKVKNNLQKSYSNCKFFSLESARINSNICSKYILQKNIKRTCKNYLNLIVKFYKTTNNLEEEKVSFNKAKNFVYNLHLQIEKLCKNFITTFAYNTSLNTAKDNLISSVKSVKHCFENITKTNFLSNLKYTFIELVLNYISFTNSIS